MTQIHLFGSATPTGEAFRQLASSNASDWSVFAYSRKSAKQLQFGNNYFVDLRNTSSFQLAGEPGAPAIWISFAPIWLLSSFLQSLASSCPERLQGMHGLIACSSSSAITKRFAANRFDRDLVARLTVAEETLLTTCRGLRIPCQILRPTLIYGHVGTYSDKNISILIKLLRLLPLLPLPSETGLRQPIHAYQLASVTVELARRMSNSGFVKSLPNPSSLPEILAVGGDQQLSYLDMLKALKMAQHPGDSDHRCLLLPIPNPLFFFLASPLLLFSPKTFEAVLRMSVDLSGFTRAHELLNRKAHQFPMLPLGR